MLLRLGVLLIAASLLPWLALAALPLIGLSGGTALAGIGLVVAAEVMFALGLALVGRDAWRAARKRGWRRAPAELWFMFRHGKARH